MNENEKEEIKDKAPLPSDDAPKVDENGNPIPTTEQDPLKNELERIQNKPKRTKVDKLLFSKKRIEQQLKEELGDEYDGDDDEPLDEDDKPLTIGEFKKFQKESTVQTALTMADEIENTIERELVKYHIENTIQPSGNPKDDLKHARAIVNSVKNAQILEEADRKGVAKLHPTGSSGPRKGDAPNDELTEQELQFTRPPFNMTKAQIIATRK